MQENVKRGFWGLKIGHHNSSIRPCDSWNEP